jgi:23S rRNA pseudouridine2605 synthase
MMLPRGLKRGRWEELDEHAVRDLLVISGLDKNAKKSVNATEAGGRRGGGQGKQQQQGKGKARARQPDPLQTALGFAGMGQPRRNAGPGRGGSHSHAGHALPGMPRRRPRG